MIYSSNEWNNLKKIIVGTATNAHWPTKCSIFREQEKTTLWKETPLPKNRVDQKIVDESNEDLENLCDVLKKLNVEVVRPDDLNFAEFDGMYNYCPRDRVLIIDDVVIDCPMLFPTRKLEINAIRKYLPSNIIQCTDKGAIFDAANICRLDENILYLISSSGNLRGAKWLQNILGNKYKVHILDNIYNGVHIDSTISPINKNLVVVNGDRINENNLPEVFKNSEIIYIYNDDINPQGFTNYPYASKYIALNFLTVRPNLVICDPNQYTIRKKLEKKGIESIGVNLRHSRTLGGGHHCVTLDLEREQNVD